MTALCIAFYESYLSTEVRTVAKPFSNTVIKYQKKDFFCSSNCISSFHHFQHLFYISFQKHLHFSFAWRRFVVIHMYSICLAYGLLRKILKCFPRIICILFKSYCTQVYSCAADFSLLNLPKGKSLGRSKPATIPKHKHCNTLCGMFLLYPSLTDLHC